MLYIGIAVIFYVVHRQSEQIDWQWDARAKGAMRCSLNTLGSSCLALAHETDKSFTTELQHVPFDTLCNC